jgi:hypothetical protein
MAAHAILSPSGASRWLACTPSARLEENYPEKTSSFAEEGTLAHSLGELLIKEKLGLMPNWKDRAASYTRIEASQHYNDAMLEYCDEYATFVIEQFSGAQAHTPDAVIHLEQKLNLTDYVPEGFGTGDVVIIADDTLTLIDLKYGKGVAVYAENNKQLMLYALGALREYDYLYDIGTVRMVIYQPRIGNISEWEIGVIDLFKWANDELRPRAAMAFAGEGEYVPGNHCQFCKAKAQCRALEEFNLQILKYDFVNPALLEDFEISDVLNRAALFTNWITAVEDHALTAAIAGKKWPGYKLVEGRSNRKYSDPEAVATLLLEKNFNEEGIYKKTLKGITDMEKYLGKVAFNGFVGPFLIKPAGKPALVPLTDKRPEYNSIDSAVSDFANI